MTSEVQHAISTGMSNSAAMGLFQAQCDGIPEFYNSMYREFLQEKRDLNARNNHPYNRAVVRSKFGVQKKRKVSVIKRSNPSYGKKKASWHMTRFGWRKY